MDEFREDILKFLKKETKLDNVPLEVPPNPEMGDLAFPCFDLAKQFKKVFSKKRKLIFVTHAPIYGTRLDDLRVNGLGHRGCKSTRKFVDEMNPVLVLCGHFHENFRKQDKIKNTLIINPGPDGTIINVD